MKPAINKQTALKAALLLLLGANISWPGGHKKELHSYDAALEIARTRPAAASPSTTNQYYPGNNDGIQIQHPTGGRVANPPQVVNVRPAPIPGQQSTTLTSGPGKKTSAHTFCGKEMIFSYQAFGNGINKVREEVYVRENGAAKLVTRCDEVGSYQSLVDDVDGLSQTERILQAHLKKSFAEACKDITVDTEDSSNCLDSANALPKTVATAAAPAGSNTSAQPAPTTDPTADEKAKRAKDVAECKTDSQGKPLDSASRLDCNQERLSSLPAVDEDDRKAKREQQSLINSIVKQIEKDARKEMKEAIVKDQDPEAAQEIAEDAKSAIEDAADLSGMSDVQAQRLSMNLDRTFQAMRVGGDLLNRTDAFKDTFDSMQQNIDWAKQQMEMARMSNDPFSYQNAQMQYNAIMNQNLMLNRQFMQQVQPEYNQLMGYQRINLLDASDVRDFSKDYMTIANGMGQIAMGPNGFPNSNPSLPPSIANLGPAPMDLMGYRTSLASDFRSNFGVGIPVRPTFANAPIQPVRPVGYQQPIRPGYPQPGYPQPGYAPNGYPQPTFNGVYSQPNLGGRAY